MENYPKSKKKITVIAIAVIFVIVAHFTKILWPVEFLVISILRPLQGPVYNLSQAINDSYNNWKNQTQWEKEAERLQQELQRSLVDKSQIKILTEENDFLRKQLDFVEANNYDMVTARVIGQSDDLSVREILISRGRSSGLQIGQPVIINDGVLIGKVYKLFDYQAIVKLINDPNSQVAVSVSNTDRTMGLISGEYGLGVKMEMIPQTEKIAIGDPVITSGLEDKIQRGLVVGTVDKVFSQPEAIFQTASIKLPANFDKLFMVSVIVGKIE